MPGLLDGLIKNQCIFFKTKLRELSLQAAVTAVRHRGAQQRGGRSENKGVLSVTAAF